MTHKRLVVASSLVGAVLCLFTAQLQLNAICPTICRTLRDGSGSGSSSSADAGSSGGSSTTDTIAAGDASYSITKVLYQCDFDPSYTIVCPGTYVFGEPIQYESSAANSSALVIAANDVTVDLNGYSLTYTIPGQGITQTPYGITYGRNTNVTGINIQPDSSPVLGQTRGTRSNILIRNGSVRLFTNAGVQASGLNYYGTAGNAFPSNLRPQGPIQNVTINEIFADNNKVGMLFMAGYTTTTIRTASQAPLTYYTISGLRILYAGASFNDNTGILFNTVYNAQITGTTTDNNGGNTNGGTGANATGIDLQNSRRISLNQNTSTLNVGLSGDSYGIYLHQNGGSSVNQSAGTYTTTNTGLSEESENFYTIESDVSQNTAELNGDWGFRDDLSPSSTVYSKNISINNGSSTGVPDGTGNYYVFYAGASGPGGDGLLMNFTKVASLSQLQGLNSAGAYDNISIGIAGTAQATSTPGITPAIITPALTV